MNDAAILRRRQSFVLVPIILAATSASAMQNDVRLSPSVSCADTSLGSHALICASAELSASEREVAEAYEATTSQVDRERRRVLQDEHRAFVTRRDQCDNTACIADEYADRLAALGRSGSSASATASEEVETGRSLSLIRENDTARTTEAENGEDQIQATETQDATASGNPGLIEPPVRVQATPPEPLGDTSSWVLPSDYPSDILRNGESGLTTYQVRVGDNGLPTGCFIIGSSGHWQLDSRACRRVEGRARFAPARDADGNAMNSIYQGEYRWVAPTEEATSDTAETTASAPPAENNTPDAESE